jgi:predicted CXXCH cytochrome family protein
MKTYKLTRNLLVGAVLSLAVGTAFAGIANTNHNLGTTGVGTTNQFDGTGEICVFCHTPHGADTSANPPLWNRVLDATGFTTYDSLGTSTVDGEVLTTVGSVSIACLSCHDGTQAMNVMINAPGSGNYDPAGSALAGTWTGPAAGVGAAPLGSLNYGTPNNIVNLGKDLTDDHPIGVEYGGGGCEAILADTCSPVAGNTRDPDFKDAVRTVSGVDQWFVDVDLNTFRDKTDMILYTRAFAAGSGPSVECGSCHDPHTESGLFLRLDNTGSAVCLACHIK